MAVPVWQASTLYPPGSFVQPSTLPPPTPVPVENGSFEDSGDEWVGVGAGTWSYPTAVSQNNAAPFHGARVAQYSAPLAEGAASLTSTTKVPVIPGQTIRAQCYIMLWQQSIFGNQPVIPSRYARIAIEWLDSGDASLSFSRGPNVQAPASPRNAWVQTSTGAAVAPAGAAFARVVLEVYMPETILAGVAFDAVTWDYAQATAGTGLLFRAIQPNTGLSGVGEPTWPDTVGNTVVDNEVTWEAVTDLPDSVVWEARPVLVSGATEPDWPVAGSVLDNTIAWEAVTRRVTDPRCPNSKVVAIAASKIFAGDDDIVAFSATVNPLDWTTRNDAGYLPFGLNTYGATPVAAIGLYRSNLVIFNSKGFQMWQVDEDPQNHAILDAVPVGCSFHKSVHPVSNDLVFLTKQGIRNIGIAGASTNIQAGFFGKQIDPLVIEKIAEAQAEGYEPKALFWPAAGQYWLFFQDEAFVLTMNGGREDQHWSRYIFPAPVSDWALLDDRLILRAGDLVWEVDEDATQDDIITVTGYDFEYTLDGLPIEGYVAWPYLDFGQLGREKLLHGFDIVFDGETEVSFGYSQSDETLATEPYFLVPGDTLTGQPIPMPLTGPSFQIRLSFLEAPWEVQAVSLYLDDTGGGT